MNFEDIKQLGDDSFMPTYSRFNAAIVSGKGACVYDVAGKEYVDFTSGIGVNSLGYGDRKWIEAVTNQAASLQHISNLYYNPTSVRMAVMLCEKSGFDKVFLCNSGAEANECAIKLARKYSFDKYGKDRSDIITLVNSFHGRTVTTLSATGQESFHNYFFPFTEGFKYAKANDINDLVEKIDGKTCAVMLETIQGEGGVVPLDGEFIKQAAEICAEKDVLLIIDEVQTGVGRTGKFYSWEHFGVRPDVLTSAKGLGNGLPIGACLCKKEYGNVLSSGQHGTTFGGNPVVCAGALEVLKRIDDDFLREVAEKGNYIKNKLSKMAKVKEVRGQGLMIGIILKDDNAKEVAAKCVENGLLILTAKKLLRMLPPLTITYEEIDKGLLILEKTINQSEVKI